MPSPLAAVAPPGPEARDFGEAEVIEFEASMRRDDPAGKEEVMSRCTSTVSVRSSKRQTVGGFTVERDDDAADDSDLESDDSNTRAQHEFMDTLCANTLIDNEMAAVMGRRNSDGKKTALKFHSALSRRDAADTPDDSFNVSHMEATRSSKSFRHTETGKSGKTSGKTRHSVGQSETVGRRGSLASTGSMAEDSITLLFSPGAAKHLQPHHSSLNRVVKHIFALDQVSQTIRDCSYAADDVKAQTRASSRLSRAFGTNSSWLLELHSKVSRVVTGDLFVGFFMLLTVYALFGPDMVMMFGSKELDDPFLTLHTIIFFLFICEFVLLSAGVVGYAFTVAALLDLVAVFSLLSDTWFMADSSLGGSRVVHQSRIARLTRVARVARVTRLVPRIMSLFRRHKSMGLAKRLLLRRLRRVFQYLDISRDGHLSSFDVKCFYLSVLQDCPQMCAGPKNSILNADLDMLVNCAGMKLEDEHVRSINFVKFADVFLATTLGNSVLDYHLKDMRDARGVWSLTAKLSDRTALKVCVGILFLLIIMKLLEVEQEEESAQQGLMHLHSMINGSFAFDSSFACEQLAIYKEDLKVLYVYIEGLTWVDYGLNLACPPSLASLSISVNPWTRIKEIMEKLQLRNTEVVQACYPPRKDESCPEDWRTTSVVLIDNQEKVKKALMWSNVSTMMVIIILMVFILGINHGINTFSRTTLHPLRALVDDMVAISSLELVNVDAEMPAEMASHEETNVEELVHLQDSFKSMRGAIRSWSRYVPPSVVERIFSAGIEASIGVSKTSASILFVDVDGFEDACRGMAPNAVNSLLASVLEQIAFVIQNNRGTLLEFIGDEVLAVFNAPNEIRSHVYAAVASSLEIHKNIATLPPIQASDGREIKIRCRCGVHTAVILAGNIGSSRRMKYGLLGDGVNLSARLKGLNTRYNTQTICSVNVVEDALSARRAVYRPLDKVAVKGKTEPTTVYEIMSFAKGNEDAAKTKEAANKHTEAFRLYHARKFGEAKVLFTQLATEFEAMKERLRLNASQLDQPARQMRRRCREYMNQPPSAEWDGVERLKAKTFEVIGDNDDMDDDEPDQLPVASEHIPDEIIAPPAREDAIVLDEKASQGTTSSLDIRSSSLCPCTPAQPKERVDDSSCPHRCPFGGVSHEQVVAVERVETAERVEWRAL